jgi:hypothetical protein
VCFSSFSDDDAAESEEEEADEEELAVTFNSIAYVIAFVFFVQLAPSFQQGPFLCSTRFGKLYFDRREH